MGESSLRKARLRELATKKLTPYSLTDTTFNSSGVKGCRCGGRTVGQIVDGKAREKGDLGLKVLYAELPVSKKCAVLVRSTTGGRKDMLIIADPAKKTSMPV